MKIPIAQVVNKEIVLKSFRVEESKFQKNKSGKCVYLQIIVDGEDRVIFTGSDVLLDQIQQVPEDAFPFITTITKPGKWYQFN